MLSGVTFNLSSDNEIAPSTSDLVVSIRGNYYERPSDNPLATLLPLRPIGVWGYHHRVPGDGLELAPNTTYWVHVDNLVVSGHGFLGTPSNAEDAHGAPGWSIGYQVLNRPYASEGGYNIHHNHALIMDLTGAPITPAGQPEIPDPSGTLAGNVGRAAAAALASASDAAQAFTTGSNAGGYALESVEVDLSVKLSANRPGIMRLLADDDGSPGDVIQTFNAPESYASERNTYVTRTAAVILSPDTTYWLMWDNFQEHDHTLGTTSSDDENAGAAGWSIGDVLHVRGRDSGEWAADADSRALTFNLVGYAVSEPAGAVLVANTGQSPKEVLEYGRLTHDRATSFRTGSSAGGYVLTSVNLEMWKDDHPNRNPDLKVHIQPIWMHGEDFPNDEPLYTLLPPAHVAGGVTSEFLAPGDGVFLVPNSTYWVVLDRKGASSYDPRVTTSTAEDVGGAAGWSIGNRVLRWTDFKEVTWKPSSDPLAMVMEVKGYARPVITIAADQASVNEADGQATFTLTRTGLLSQELTVNVAVSETGGSMLASDQPTTAIFAANSATATLTVSLVDDAPIALNSVVTATVQSGEGYAPGNQSSASVTVTDDDTVRVTIEADNASVSEADGQATFTLTRIGGDHSGGLTVNLSVTETGGSMLPANAPTTVPFAANSATATLTVSLVDDAPIALDSVVTATVQGGDGYLVGSTSAASVTVIDDEPSTVTIQADNANVSEADGQASFTLTRTGGDHSQLLTVNVSVSEDESMLAASQPPTATFDANSDTTTLTVSLDDDTADERDSTVTATVTDGDGYEVGSPSEATVDVADDDLPIITVMADSPGVSEGGSAAFTLMREGDAGSELTVNVTVQETGSMVAANPPTAATFAVGSTTASLAVRTVDDRQDEADSTVTATIQPGGDYNVGSPASAEVSVADDDEPAFFIYHDPNHSPAAVNRFNTALELLNDAEWPYSVRYVSGDYATVDQLAKVSGTIIPRFFLGDPEEPAWGPSQPQVNNGGLRWLRSVLE